MATAETTPRIFERDGGPLAVFAQADIFMRPQLARRLKKGGALMCTDPKVADVVLVDQNSRSGQNFLSVWGSNKVILHYGWVQSCCDAGRLLGQEDNYGGKLAQAQDVSDDELADDVGHPADVALPTPRPSPENLEQTLSKSAQAPIPRTSPNLLVHQAPLSQPETQMHASTLRVSSHPAPFHTVTPHTDDFPIHSVALESTDPANAVRAGHAATFDTPGDPGWGIPPPNQYPIPSPLTGGPHFMAPPPAPSMNMLMATADVLASSDDPGLRRYGMQMKAIDPSVLVNYSTHQSLGGQLIAPPTPIPPIDTAEIPSRSVSMERPSASQKRPTERQVSGSFSGDPIFYSNGIPKRFFIQIEHVRRNTLAPTVKNNGGKLEPSIEKSDYAILYPTGALKMTKKHKEFEKHLHVALAHNVPVINGSFVEDCYQEGRLLDYTPYLLTASGTQKRKKPLVSSDSDDEQEVTTPMKQPPPPKKAQKISKTPPRTNNARGAADRFMNKYTEEEKNDVVELALQMFTEDPDAAFTEIAKAAHAKMPRHTVTAWTNTLQTRYRVELDAARKKGGIQFRKRQRQLMEQEQRQNQSRECSSNYTTSGSHLQTPQHPYSPIASLPVVHRNNSSKDFERDMEDIANFFAKGDDEEFGQGDERDSHRSDIFRKLERQVRCRTMPKWEAFHGRYAEQIQSKVDEKAAEFAGPDDHWT